jgi:uroporphyrinogen-III decarboxylase
MTPRERMLATFAGQPVDCFPVTTPYPAINQADHWTIYTGQETWTYYDWAIQPPEQHVKEYERYSRQIPYDISHPHQWAVSRAVRPFLRIVPSLEGQGYDQLNTLTGERLSLVLNLHEKDQESEWPRRVFTPEDAETLVGIPTTQQILDEGTLDYIQAFVQAYGQRHYTTAAVVNAFYNASHYVGLTNRFMMLHDEPELLHFILDRLTRRNIEEIRAFKRAGCDAVLIDDATATKDMISLAMYKEFSLPYLKRLIEAIHEEEMKAMVVYFGGIADRVEEIVSSGADALLMEASMKGFVNNLETIAAQVNDRLLMFGNLNPRDDVELKTDEELAAVMAQQIAVGKKFGRFVISTGSPHTPGTSLKRLQDYIHWGHCLSAF